MNSIPIQISQGISNLNLLAQRTKPQHNNVGFIKTLPQLKRLLQQNNLKYHYPMGVIQKCGYYMSKKGVILNDLEEIAQRNMRMPRKNKDKQTRSERNYFYVDNLQLDKINELIEKTYEYNIFSNIEIAMSQQEHKTFESKLPTKIGIGSRNDQKFRQYNRIVSEFMSNNINGIQVNPIQLLRLFQNTSNTQFWETIVILFQGIFFEDTQNVIKDKIMNNSIRLLEEQFNRKLPLKDISSLEMYVKAELLDKLVHGRNYVHFDNKGRPIWAIIFMLMRAGRISYIKQILISSSYKQLFSDFNSYLSGEAKYYRINEQVKDVFLQAIYSIFNRKSEINFDIITNQKDFLWFALKTVSISEGNMFTLRNLQDQISQRYDNNPTRQNFINLLLVLAFDKTLQPNPFFDSDDVNHFALFLYILRMEQDGFSNTNTREMFYQKMINYSQELMTTNFQSALDYVILCFNKITNPTSKVLSMISQLLIYTTSVQKYFGYEPISNTSIQQRVKISLLPTKSQYQNFIFQTMSTYTGISKNYLYSAKVYVYVIKNANQSALYLLDILTKGLITDNFIQNHDVSEYLKLFQSTMETHQLKSGYNRLYQFIKLTYYVKDIVQTNKQVDEILLSSKYFPNKSQFSLQSQQILLDLSSAKKMQVYSVFLFFCLKAIIKYYEFKPNKTKSYMDSLLFMKKHCQRLKDHGVSHNSSTFFNFKMCEIQRQLQLIIQ